MSLKLEIIFRFSECYKIFFYRASVNQCEIPLFSGILLLLLHIVGGFSINWVDSANLMNPTECFLNYWAHLAQQIFNILYDRPQLTRSIPEESQVDRQVGGKGYMGGWKDEFVPEADKLGVKYVCCLAKIFIYVERWMWHVECWMLLVGAKVALFGTRRRRRPFYDPWGQLAPSAGFAFATFLWTLLFIKYASFLLPW